VVLGGNAEIQHADHENGRQQRARQHACDELVGWMSVHFYTSLNRKPRRADGPDAKVAGKVRGGLGSRCYRETAYFSSQAWLRSIRHFSKRLMNGQG
jgi:hypothetical protein